jgi:O-antigen ligase
MVFLRFSMLHQFANYFAHANLYLLYLFGIPALLGVLISGGIRRTFQGRPAYWLTGCALWFVITIPFSSWRGDSFHAVVSYLRADFPILFIVAGLTLTWKDCERIMFAAALGAVVNLLWARMFDAEQGGRLSMRISTIGNSNDYAGHMILGLAFVLWIAINAQKSRIIRMAALLSIVVGILLIIRTGSRGALVALFAVFLLFLYRANMTQRMALVLVAPIVLAIALASVPKTILTRITSFSAGEAGAPEEALMSTSSRKYLFRKSIEYTFTHPLFGIGVGQFASYEGNHNKITGEHGAWKNTHNSYTAISSETGLPGFILYLGAIFSIIGTFRKINLQARQRPECQDITAASFCAMVGTIGYSVVILFLNFAYFFYFPCLGGLAIAMRRAADHEFQNRQRSATLVPEALPPRRPIVRPEVETAPV